MHVPRLLLRWTSVTPAPGYSVNMAGTRHRPAPAPPIGRRRFGRRGAWVIAIVLLVVMFAIAVLIWTLFAPEAETPKALLVAVRSGGGA
jgi:hypothetical protein